MLSLSRYFSGREKWIGTRNSLCEVHRMVLVEFSCNLEYGKGIQDNALLDILINRIL